MICPTCGAALPEDARYCPACGRPVHAAADERRIVTVLFADLVGFTSLAERRDPEQVKGLVDRCFSRLAGDVAAHGGRIDKVIGDGLLALFGAPVAHEDDPERAVRTALQMQATLCDVAAELAADLQMRIGVNTGEVLVGARTVGDDYTAMGDVVNTASRLQTAAQPGQVVVGPATYAATSASVRYESLGEVDVRGRDEPVRAWAALEVLTAPGTRPRRRRAPLVGRAAELHLLESALTLSSRGRPQLLALVGEPGIGKTRLAEEAAGRAERENGTLVLEGRALPYGAGDDWWPIATAVRGLLDLAGDEPPDVVRARIANAVGGEGEAARTVEAVAFLLGVPSGLADIDPPRARDEIARAVQDLLASSAASAPVILLLDDVQWAPEPVQQLVARLLDRSRGLALAIVTTSREPVALPLTLHHDAVLLQVQPLRREDTAALLSSLLESELTGPACEALLDRAGGNPLYVEEFVALVGRGADPLAMPDSLRSLASARLDALSAEERAVVHDAAVLGRRGPEAALGALAAARHAPDAERALRGLEGSDVLDRVGGRFEFRSEVLQEVAYATLTKADRARRHLTVADWARTAGEPDGDIDVAAYHLGLAATLAAELGAVDGLPRDLHAHALDAILEAARRAEHVENHRRAAAHYQRSLELVSDADPGREAILLGHAGALIGMHDLDAARADVEAVLAGAPRESPGWVRARTMLGDIQQKQGDLDDAIATLQDAVAAAAASGDRRAKAGALRLTGMTRMFRGELADAEAAIEAGLEAFEHLGDDRGRAWALQNLAWIAYVRDDTTLADERLRVSEELFREVGDPGGLGWAHGLLSWVRLHQGRYAEAEALALGALPDAIDVGDRRGQARLLIAISSVRMWTGRTADAVQYGQQAVDVSNDINDAFGLVNTLPVLARALVARGRAREAFTLLERAIEESGRVLGPYRSPYIFSAAAAAGAHAGVADRALQYGARFADADEEGTGVVAYALGLAMSGRLDEATARLETTGVGPMSTGSGPYISSALALVRAASGRLKEARAAADEVDATEHATYLDRVTAAIGRGLADAAEKDQSATETAFATARAHADGSDDLVAQLVVRLAEGHARAHLGDAAAAELLADARRRAEALDTYPAGWEALISRTLGRVETLP